MIKNINKLIETSILSNLKHINYKKHQKSEKCLNCGSESIIGSHSFSKCWFNEEDKMKELYSINYNNEIQNLLFTNQKKDHSVNNVIKVNEQYEKNDIEKKIINIFFNRHKEKRDIDKSYIFSVFYLLCSKCDEKLFKKIDDKFDYKNKNLLDVLLKRLNYYHYYKGYQFFKNTEELNKNIKETLDTHENKDLYKKNIINSINILINELESSTDSRKHSCYNDYIRLSNNDYYLEYFDFKKEMVENLKFYLLESNLDSLLSKKDFIEIEKKIVEILKHYDHHYELINIKTDSFFYEHRNISQLNFFGFVKFQLNQIEDILKYYGININMKNDDIHLILLPFDNNLIIASPNYDISNIFKSIEEKIDLNIFLFFIICNFMNENIYSYDYKTIENIKEMKIFIKNQSDINQSAIKIFSDLVKNTVL